MGKVPERIYAIIVLESLIAEASPPKMRNQAKIPFQRNRSPRLAAFVHDVKRFVLYNRYTAVHSCLHQEEPYRRMVPRAYAWIRRCQRSKRTGMPCCRRSRAIPALSTPSPSRRMAGCWRRYRGTRRSGCGTPGRARRYTRSKPIPLSDVHHFQRMEHVFKPAKDSWSSHLLIAFLYSAGSSTIHFHLHALDKQRQRNDSLVSSRIQTDL
jgi:hypothetical protein